MANRDGWRESERNTGCQQAVMIMMMIYLYFNRVSKATDTTYIENGYLNIFLIQKIQALIFFNP